MREAPPLSMKLIGKVREWVEEPIGLSKMRWW
jgi:hypothetical protein